MSSDSQVISLILHIQEGADTDTDELDHLTRQLQVEIEELDVESIELMKRETLPGGVKSIEAVNVGVLAVKLLPGVLPKLLEFLYTRLGPRDSRVKIKAQVGDRALEVEYSPRTMPLIELRALVNTLTQAVTEGKDERSMPSS